LSGPLPKLAAKETFAMRGLHYLCLTLVIVGAINWGLVGLFQFDLVATLFGGQDSAGARIIYSLVGLAGLCVAATSAALYPESRRASLTTSQATIR
jgi:uncharacterized membrane protein YuzA (DUF378 family)